MLKSEADLDLLKRYATGGDPDAFGEIVRRYTALVYHTCLRVLHDKALAEDASQDTFYRLMRAPGSVNRSVGAWLHRTATRRSLDVLRSDTARARRERAYSNEYYHGKANPPSWNVLSPMIDEALAQLPEPTRSLLVDHFLAGKTQRQLAQETQTSAATVSRRIKQGLQELRQHIKTTGMAIGAAALLSMLASQTALAAPPQISAELGKMAMISGDPAALGSGGISGGAVALKIGAMVVGIAALALVMFGLIQIGNGPATIIPATEQEGTRAAAINQAVGMEPDTSAQALNGNTGVYIIPHQDQDFDSQRVASFQIQPRGESGLVNLGYADGHVEQLDPHEADTRIHNQTGKTMGELMKTLPVVPEN
jgi:RNA polymerase sigma factor (sigma-70 family)